MSGMIVIPASLRSDFIHMAGMTIHIAQESTIHIAGIRTSRSTPSLFIENWQQFAHVLAATNSRQTRSFEVE
jgi:hypothetical protein